MNLRGSLAAVAAVGTLTAGVPACEQPELRLNDIQVLASHNSYKLAIEPSLLARIALDDPETAFTLDYEHAPLVRQLDLGIRAFELDVYYDPDGGRYASPLGVRSVPDAVPFDVARVMQTPGFKVLHVQDIDFRSSCLLLAECLASLRTWSEANPHHVPIVITVNAKDERIDSPGFVEPLAFDAPAWDALDAELRAGLADKHVSPDEVRGNESSLEAAVLGVGWPSLDSLRGRFLVALDDSPAKMDAYALGHPGLEGRAMFANLPEGRPEAAVRIMNDPVDGFAAIQTAVKRGYLVRTRADADTREARDNDTRRAVAAFASGAQIVSTDYYSPDERYGEYRVGLPGGGIARCNPVRTNAPCRVEE